VGWFRWESRTPQKRERRILVPSLGAEFVARPGETLLDAALAAGVAIPWNCRVGSCGTCVCRLLSGEVKKLTDFSYVLDASQLRSGHVLACQSIAQSADVQLQVGAECDLQPAAIVSIDRIAEGIYRVALSPQRWHGYHAGQYLRIRSHPDVGNTRCYSLASHPPASPHHYELCVKRQAAGRVSHWLTDPANVGKSVQISPPSGSFHLRRQRPVPVFAAGGSGIGPIKAMLEEMAIANDARSAHLFYGARDTSHLAYADTLRVLAERSGGRLSLTFAISSASSAIWTDCVRGRVTQHISRVSDFSSAAELYVCGGAGFVNGVVQDARARGLPGEHIHTESFG
jgi:ferredoxin-NADP reductase/ferredoxin